MRFDGANANAPLTLNLKEQNANNMKNKLIIDGKEIPLSDETVKSLKQSLGVKSGLWKPKEGEQYFYNNNCGNTAEGRWCSDFIDGNRLSINNIFPSYQLAQKEVDKRRATQRVRNYIADNFGVFKPDWKDGEQAKYSVFYDNRECDQKGFRYENLNDIKQYSPFGHMKALAECNQLIKECEDDLKIIFEV